MIQFKKYYITTPIYYPNDVPHIGHAYTTIVADVLARWARLKKADVFFLTGTDEHGEKVENAAKEANKSPREFCDNLVEQFKEAWAKLNIKYSRFIRTTDPEHEELIKVIIKRCHEKGDIYLGEYEDWYCVPCESFWTSTQLVKEKCPSCGREVKKLKEPSYFFKLSKYQDALLDLYEQVPDFISPPGKRQEVINRVHEGLHDLSISRTKLKWGIPFPLDKKHTTYVWFDALLNYITGLDYLKNKKNFEKYWPPDVQLVGKDILWFHTVIWPAMLLSAGLPLPRKVFAHGWWTIEGEKISKSKGNAITVDELSKIYGADRIRFVLLKAMPFGADGDFSRKEVAQLINSELADNVGNFVHRVLVLTKKLSNGKVPKVKKLDKSAEKIFSEIKKVSKSVDAKIGKLEFFEALQEILDLARLGNQYLNEKEPWKNKDLTSVSVSATLIRSLAVLLYPFIPESSDKIWKQLGEKKSIEETGFGAALEKVKEGQAIGEPSPIIEKLEYKEPELKFSGKKVVLDKEIGQEMKKGNLSGSVAEVIGFKVQRRNGALERLKKEVLAKHDEKKARKVVDSYRYLLEKRDKGTEGLASEQILNFVKKAKQIPNINTIADIYNLISFKTGLIMGAYDSSAISGNVHLRVADGTENFVPIGTKEKVKIYPQEYVLADDSNKVITRWLTKEHEDVKIAKGAKGCIVCVQGSKGIPQKEVDNAIKEICGLIVKFCGGKYKILYP